MHILSSTIDGEISPPIFAKPSYDIKIPANAAVGELLPIDISFQPELDSVSVELFDRDDLFSYDEDQQSIEILVAPDAEKHGDSNFIRNVLIRASIEDENGAPISSDSSLIVYYQIPIGNS